MLCAMGATRCLEALQGVEGGYPDFVMDMLASTPPDAITEHPLFYRCSRGCMHAAVRGPAPLLCRAHMRALYSMRQWELDACPLSCCQGA